MANKQKPSKENLANHLRQNLARRKSAKANSNLDKEKKPDTEIDKKVKNS